MSTTTIKLSTKQLSEMVRHLTKKLLAEAKDAAANDSGVGKYAEKVDKLVLEMIEKIDDLHEEGVGMIIDNPTHDYAVQERNQSVLSRVGILKALKTKLVQLVETLHMTV